MAIPGNSAPTQLIFGGNAFFLICCVFYLAWWLLAFKPTGAIKGMKSGWLLLPALAAGGAAVLLALRGIGALAGAALFPASRLLGGGAAAYLLLLAATRLLFKRPATTELLLIVSWATLALAEINALRGGALSRRAALGLAAAVAAAAAASLVCYVLYYRLGSRARYLDGMLPLLSAALTMAAINLCMAL